MFEPNEEEARRDRAIEWAVVSTATTEIHHMERGTKLILDRAKEIEKYLKDGVEPDLGPPSHDHGPLSAFGQYQQGGLDASST